MSNANIGMIGLGVMGSNLARNMVSKGFTVSCYDWDESFRKGFASEYTEGFFHADSLKAFVESIERPRKIMIMIKAGSPVDSVLGELAPLLQPGDVVIDGGNSQWEDTERRIGFCEEQGLLFVGCGVSGGEEGALNGPAMMPGGSAGAWELIKPIFEAIAARTPEGVACVDWVGIGGSGHFVKMVHNGIEYGDMQMICETYQVMRDGLSMSNIAMSEVFGRWNNGKLDSYLIEITRDILAFETEDGEQTVDMILDAAGQKGTGKWTLMAALDAGEPLPLIGEAVFARCLSALKSDREEAAKWLAGPKMGIDVDQEDFVEEIKQALYGSKIISYAQGFQLIQQVSKEQGWNLDLARLAQLWRGGCIIRSVLLRTIKEAFQRSPDLSNLLLDPLVAEAVGEAQVHWRNAVACMTRAGIASPAMSSALSYYDGFRTARGSANLLQAQRDYFGAHTYERIDQPRGEFFHTQWF
ncbi:decarboxylating NADP(+)-dependent phosphogluconate dehydrogenase [Pontiella sulfatireligans]|uniref:6-phosphogluconate dehydrogenase, decarboxylating n=1 Tax=Pontiella sulfatireligans TaxID=2750658 RepID=A0A6C2UVG8_9BACT|nr:decarboxylating NADP(+)-dependent phosphogluconate dehydrogenase [Pontiella sulfatireligans]VGO23107.1 6-phosphogluconate dehydrogenase, decarboxylating [Pontiella sulfatireligans]